MPAGKDPMCYLEDSCCEKAFVEWVARAFPLCEIWADKDRMLVVIEGGRGAEAMEVKRQAIWALKPEISSFLRAL